MCRAWAAIAWLSGTLWSRANWRTLSGYQAPWDWMHDALCSETE
jgi:hypothetical protein